MKLINILDNLDILSEVVIWNFDEAEDTNWEEPTFEGCVMDVPYYLTKINADIYHIHSARLVETIITPFVKSKMCVTQHSTCDFFGSTSLKKFKHIYAILL